MKPHEHPADVVLEALRRASFDYRSIEAGIWSWQAQCPVCRASDGRRTLRISETGAIGSPVSLRCANGCREDEVLAALTRTVRRETAT